MAMDSFFWFEKKIIILAFYIAAIIRWNARVLRNNRKQCLLWRLTGSSKRALQNVPRKGYHRISWQTGVVWQALMHCVTMDNICRQTFYTDWWSHCWLPQTSVNTVSNLGLVVAVGAIFHEVCFEQIWCVRSLRDSATHNICKSRFGKQASVRPDCEPTKKNRMHTASNIKRRSTNQIEGYAGSHECAAFDLNEDLATITSFQNFRRTQISANLPVYLRFRGTLCRFRFAKSVCATETSSLVSPLRWQWPHVWTRRCFPLQDWNFLECFRGRRYCRTLPETKYFRYSFWNHVYLRAAIGRPEPEYTPRRVMSSEPIHDEQLTKDCKQMTYNRRLQARIDGLVNCKHTIKLYEEKMWMVN